MKRTWGVGGVVVALMATFACGSEGADAGSSSSGGEASSGGDHDTDAGHGTSSSSSSSSGDVAATAVDLTELGVWTVAGTDARGPFTGEVELLKRADGSLHFARTVTYPGVVVEDAKELHLAWTGTLADLQATEATLGGGLDPRGYIVTRGDAVHALSDAVTTTSAQVTRAGAAITAAWTVGTETFSETWTEHRASAATPIFENLRTFVPAHDPPSATTKAALFATYAQFQAQPLVAPYADRADFEAAIFTNVMDPTDADFYRAHPNALRVIDRPVDPISLQEAERRRSAYAPTLEAKAAAFDADMTAAFLEDGVRCSPNSLGNGTPGNTAPDPSGDGSLWTGSYVVSQVQRYRVTASAEALANVEHSASSMAKLQEITGDSHTFARTLRKAEPDASGTWHHGTGDFTDLDWLEGGNNDMFTGLVLTYSYAYPLLCQGALAASHAALCTRIRNNVDHMPDLDVASGSGNDLDALWLKAIVFPTDFSTRAKAEAAWQQEKLENRFYAVNYTYGIGPDWSGTNLTFSGTLAESRLAEQLELGGDAKAELGSFIDRSQEEVKGQRLANWHLLRAMYGATPPDAQWVQDAKWRLRELPSPKEGVAISHPISPEFCMAPYPSLPWKNDWNVPGHRLQSLSNFPLFEGPADVFVWRLGLDYASNGTGRRYPGSDYLYLYWLAREAGVLAAGE